MSVILAVSTPKIALIAADTQVTHGDGSVSYTSKIFPLKRGGLVGATGSWGMARRLVYLLNKYDTLDDIPIKEWLESTLWDAELVFLAPDRRVFSIDGPHSIIELDQKGFHAAGCGGDVAAAAFCTLLGRKSIARIDAKTLIKWTRQAVETACAMNLYCGGDIELRSLVT